MTDAGMTGDYDSAVGMKKDEPLRRFTTGISSGRFESASRPGTMSGVAVQTDDDTRLAVRIAPVRLGGVLKRACQHSGLEINTRSSVDALIRSLYRPG